MGVELVLSLLGGLALFMYGMQMMSTNLEAVAGNRMKQILERLTANRFSGSAGGGRNHSPDSVVFSHNRHDSWICQLGSYDT